MKARDATPLCLAYTNWRGETSTRRIVPLAAPHFGSTEWHPEPTWLLRAWDADKQAEREFALSGFARANAERIAAAFGAAEPVEWRVSEERCRDLAQRVGHLVAHPAVMDRLVVDLAQDALDARAALARRPAEGWRDIASAPKDAAVQVWIAWLVVGEVCIDVAQYHTSGTGHWELHGGGLRKPFAWHPCFEPPLPPAPPRNEGGGR